MGQLSVAEVRLEESVGEREKMSGLHSFSRSRRSLPESIVIGAAATISPGLLGVPQGEPSEYGEIGIDSRK
jgi:hypothetical protein